MGKVKELTKALETPLDFSKKISNADGAHEPLQMESTENADPAVASLASILEKEFNALIEKYGRGNIPKQLAVDVMNKAAAEVFENPEPISENVINKICKLLCCTEEGEEVLSYLEKASE